MRKLLRYLRIAFSSLCGVACLLLLAMWVRSNWYWDELYNPISNKHLIIVESASSRVIVRLTTTLPGSPWLWHISHELRGEYWGGPLIDWEETNRYKGFGGFAAYANPWHTTYRAPYWFLVLLFATLAVIPWLRWSKRFSLRTLLIVTTLLAVVLGLAVYAGRN